MMNFLTKGNMERDKKKALKKLKGKFRIRVMKKLSNKGYTVRKIGKIFGLSGQRVHQLLSQSLNWKRRTDIRVLRRARADLIKLLIYKVRETNKDFKVKPAFLYYTKSISEMTGMDGGSRDRYRELVRIRDNHTCSICGKKWQEGTRRLDVHHMDEAIMGKIDTRDIPVKYDKDNMDKLITLCHKCHLNLHYGNVELLISKRV